jgi:serine/threonine protein kinase
MGCILYKLLCGKLPFDTTNAGKLLLAHVEQPVIPPVTSRPDLPLWLSHLTMKLLAKTTRERIQSAEQALEILQTHLHRGPGSISGAYNRDDHDVAERREAARASASRRTGDPEIAELLRRQKRATVMSTAAALIGIVAFVLYPTIRGVQTYWNICDLLMLGSK